MSTRQPCPCPCPCPHPGVTGAPALEAHPPKPTTPRRRAGEQGTTKTRSGSYGSARKANFSLQPCSAVGALEREERGQGRSEPREQPLPSPRGTRRRKRTAALTYRRAHRSPQPRLPLWTADGELAPHPGHHVCLAPVLPTHLFSLHVRSNDGPVRANDDAGLSLLSLQESRRHNWGWMDWHRCPGSGRVRECKALPSAPASPASQASPGPLLVPPGPARRSRGHQPPAAAPKRVAGSVTRVWEQGAPLPGEEGWPAGCQPSVPHSALELA